MQLRITLDGLPPCPRCDNYGGVVMAVEPHYTDVDDGYGPRLVGYEPKEWDYCGCDYGRYLKLREEKRQAEEDARMDAIAAEEADRQAALMDGGGW
ncbi:hypothetical protein D3C86_1530740 [compost metagenome]